MPRSDIARADLRSPAILACAKCDGTGRIDAFTHVHGGACFQCDGTGKSGLTITDAEILANTVSNLWATQATVMGATRSGDDERAAYYLANMVEDMRRVGTDTAREILNAFLDCTYFDSLAQADFRIAAAQGQALRAQLIDLGRATA